jgi:energy-converting hydrogenase Eha subunit E
VSSPLAPVKQVVLPGAIQPVSRVLHKESIQVFLFFSNRIGCLGSLVVSAILTLILLAAFHVL